MGARPPSARNRATRDKSIEEASIAPPSARNGAT